jgi:hypothetical protein
MVVDRVSACVCVFVCVRVCMLVRVVSVCMLGVSMHGDKLK